MTANFDMSFFLFKKQSPWEAVWRKPVAMAPKADHGLSDEQVLQECPAGAFHFCCPAGLERLPAKVREPECLFCRVVCR